MVLVVLSRRMPKAEMEGVPPPEAGRRRQSGMHAWGEEESENDGVDFLCLTEEDEWKEGSQCVLAFLLDELSYAIAD